MRNNRIYILTGDIRSGKTTALQQWASLQPKVHGFLTPDVEGWRMCYDLSDGRMFSFQKAQAEGENEVCIGRFVFDRQGFVWMQAMLTAHCQNSDTPFIVDEVGKLELAGEGIASALHPFLAFHQTSTTPVILVVRASLLQAVQETFGLQDAHVLFLSDINEDFIP